MFIGPSNGKWIDDANAAVAVSVAQVFTVKPIGAHFFGCSRSSTVRATQLVVHLVCSARFCAHSPVPPAGVLRPNSDAKIPTKLTTTPVRIKATHAPATRIAPKPSPCDISGAAISCSTWRTIQYRGAKPTPNATIQRQPWRCQEKCPKAISHRMLPAKAATKSKYLPHWLEH